MKTPAKRSRTAWLALVLALQGVAGPTPARCQTFSEEIGVTVVEVPVQVLRRGRPVPGLTADDFEIYDRGELQQITGFEVVHLSAAVPGGIPGTVPGSPPDASASDVRGRHLLLLFDFVFSRPHLLGRAVAGARRMVASQLDAADRVAVAIYGGTGARILVGFTTDRSQSELGLSFVEALLHRDRRRLEELSPRLMATWAAGTEGAAARSRTLSRLSSQLGLTAALLLSGSLGLTRPENPGADAATAARAGLFGLGPDGFQGGLSEGQLGALSPDDLLRQAEIEAGLHAIGDLGESLAELATLLRAVPQPKHLLYLSEGFPTAYLRNKEARGRVINRMQPMVEAFRATGWALQAIDIEGVPDLLTAGGRSAATMGPLGSTQTLGYEAMRGSSRSGFGSGFDAEALFHMAQETGGEVVENHNDVEEATLAVLERTAVTYLLAFQPPDLEADGSTHRLEVRLKNGHGEVSLRHRLGYLAPKPRGERTALERDLDEADLISGDRTVDGLPARVLAYPATAAGDLVPVLIEIPGPELLAAGVDSVRLSIQAYALGPDDSVYDVAMRQIQLDTRKVGAQLQRGGLRLTAGLAAPEGEHRVRVIVRHLDTGAVFARTARVEVGARAGDRPVLLPPVFVDRSDRFLNLHLTAAASGAEQRHPFRAGDRDISPWLDPEIAPDQEEIVLVLLELPDGASPSLSSRVLTATGSRTPGGQLRWIQRIPAGRDGVTRLLSGFRATGLEPGGYLLEISVRDQTTGLTASGVSAFTVVRR